MARGYKDYGARDPSLTSLEFLNREPIYQVNDEEIDDGDTQLIISYDVPAGYQLYITHMTASLDSPGMALAVYSLKSGHAVYVHFDQHHMFSLGDNGVYTSEAGDTVRIILTNYTGFHVFAYASIMGYLVPA